MTVHQKFGPFAKSLFLLISLVVCRSPTSLGASIHQQFTSDMEEDRLSVGFLAGNPKEPTRGVVDGCMASLATSQNISPAEPIQLKDIEVSDFVWKELFGSSKIIEWIDGLITSSCTEIDATIRQKVVVCRRRNAIRSLPRKLELHSSRLGITRFLNVWCLPFSVDWNGKEWSISDTPRWYVWQTEKDTGGFLGLTRKTRRKLSETAKIDKYPASIRLTRSGRHGDVRAQASVLGLLSAKEPEARHQISSSSDELEDFSDAVREFLSIVGKVFDGGKRGVTLVPADLALTALATSHPFNQRYSSPSQ